MLRRECSGRDGLQTGLTMGKKGRGGDGDRFASAAGGQSAQCAGPMSKTAVDEAEQSVVERDDEGDRESALRATARHSAVDAD